VTRADSPIDDVLKARAGVCQDFAHVMIAICRSWGIPARYVSGYLFTDRKHGDRSDPDATHAWVEVFLPSLRWIGFDPTNNSEATERHLTCAIGRDYSDVPPSRGVYKGEAESQLAVGVTVRKARAAISEPEFLKVSRPAAHNGPFGRRPQPGSAAYEQQQRLHQMQQQQQQ
jgi:transglutaminase-like putative cysteine protease